MLDEPTANGAESANDSTAHLVHALMHFLLAVRYRKNVVIAALLVAALGGGLYYMTATPLYRSTAAILVMGTGNAVAFDEDGKAIARNPGQIRFELLIDHGGTPQDPSDDEFLADLGLVFGSTGRNDDFCGAVVPALSG